MEVRTLGKAVVRRIPDGAEFEIDSSELEWEAVGGSDRQMGPETEYRAIVSHEELGELAWSLWEYPAGVLNYTDHNLNGHRLVQDFDIRLEEEAPERIYFLDYEEGGIDADFLRELPEEEQVPYLVAWFKSNYEDPVQETPYNGREGGYQYIWGGPYDAREELEDEFAGIASDGAIALAVEEVESDGTTEWAPGRDHANHDRAADEFYETERSFSLDELRDRLEAIDTVDLNSDAARRAQASLRDASKALLARLEDLQPRHGGIGHNGPPRDDNGAPLPSGFSDDLRSAAHRLVDEAESDEPDPVAVIEAAGRLERLRVWLQPRVDKFADSFAEESGKRLAQGVAIVATVALASIVPGLDLALDAALHWLATILGF